MAYRIRYGGRLRRRRDADILWIQCLWAAGVLAAAALCAFAGGVWRETVGAIFLPGDVIVTVGLTAAGEGWYEALARLCGEIIRGTH